ncbi:amidase [Siminovitchia acidinfaciens]|uniref:amidase n=1 Tax=Siminovitchia acidinfaciens TaxID=2321395 RepID=UPI0013E025FC|nr:amidase [Siminovitchia acidinfaciens]
MSTTQQLRNNVLENDLISIAAMIKAKELSPKELIKETILNIEKTNPQINAYITILEEDMLKQAYAAEEEIMKGSYRGLLHGIPVGIKDLIFTKGVRTTMGSRLFKDFVPDRNADAVNRLIDAGAIITGKLNTHELAFGTTGDQSYFGAVKNPYDHEKITGGSSSGSAAAVAAHMCLAAIGTDTGGSIRIPASFCNVVGMKPTYGRVSKEGVQPLAPSLDHVGPITKNVKDNMLIFKALLGEDLNQPFEQLFAGLDGNLKGTRIGLPKGFFVESAENEIRGKIVQTAAAFEKLGAEVTEVKMNHMEDLRTAHRIVLVYEAYQVYKSRLDEMEEGEVKERLESGRNINQQEYRQAKEMQAKGKLIFQEALKQVDTLLTPVTPITQKDLFAREITCDNKKVHIFSVLNKLTGITDLTGSPSLSVPCGMTRTGLPIGFQLIGRDNDEETLYRVGYAFEQTI